MLNKQKGNMYGFVTHTWNAIKGKCSHDCKYCYMKIFKLNDLRLDEKELKTDLGNVNYIFVGSSTDMFAKDVPNEWIKRVLKYCSSFKGNRYLFQSKNPMRFYNFISNFPEDSILGTTIESNRFYEISNAPPIKERINAMSVLPSWLPRMITIEPILDFDVEELLNMIKKVNPKWVNIGADSKGHNLPEPDKKKINRLKKGLSMFTTVSSKSNLERIK